MKRLLLLVSVTVGLLGTALGQVSDFTTVGNQNYTVPGPGTITITTRGGDGASTIAQGGSGATVKAEFPVEFGDELIVVVGEAGVGNISGSGFGGGGGGSAVILTRDGVSTLLIVASGGGGSSLVTSEGKGGSAADGTPGGGSSPAATGGGGFNADGDSRFIPILGILTFSGGKKGTLTGGGAGGKPFTGASSGGFGFGGGGSGNNLLASGGGGGGYGGGKGGDPLSGGSGGTSFIETGTIAGTNPVRTNGANGGGTMQNGFVTLDFECGVEAPNLFTNYDDERFPGGQQSASVCQNSGDVTFEFSGCQGGTVNWTGTDGTSSTGIIVATSANVGTVTYSATCTIGACESDPSDVSVTTNAPPTVSVSGITSVIFTPTAGSNCTTLTANPVGTAPFTYSWMLDGAEIGTEADQQVCPETTTTYSVMVTDANGCSASTEVTVNVKDVRCGPGNKYVTICYYGTTQCVREKTVKNYLKLGATLGACGSGNANVRIGVEETLSDAPFELSVMGYPNPTQGPLTVEVISKITGPAQMQVLDLTGRAVQQRTEQLLEGRNEVKFDLTAQPSGTYLIRAIDALNHQGVVRVSKQ